MSAGKRPLVTVYRSIVCERSDAECHRIADIDVPTRTGSYPHDWFARHIDGIGKSNTISVITGVRSSFEYDTIHTTRGECRWDGCRVDYGGRGTIDYPLVPRNRSGVRGIDRHLLATSGLGGEVDIYDDLHWLTTGSADFHTSRIPALVAKVVNYPPQACA